MAVRMKNIAALVFGLTALIANAQVSSNEELKKLVSADHSSNPDDIKLAFSLATISARLAPTHPAPKWLAAAAWDRYMMWKKLPQWYGTQSQFSRESGKTSLYPILPNAVSDEERAEAQIPPLIKIMPDAEAKEHHPD